MRTGEPSSQESTTSLLPDGRTVIVALTTAGTPLSWLELKRQLKVSGRNEAPFKQLLKHLAQEGKIQRLKGRRYVLPQPGETGKALPPVAKSVTQKREDGSLRARVVREGKHLFALVHEGGAKLKFILPKAHQGDAKAGKTVLIKPLERSGPFGYPAAKVLLGVKPAPTFGEVAQHFFKETSLPHAYPKQALIEATLAQEPNAEDLKGRKDLRSLHVVTIDPIDAKDHDDAISLEQLPNGNWKLGVHIADVAEYVEMDSALDEEALNRSFTQYLPWTAVPMLPDSLSGNLCSLLEHKNRFAFSCFMEVGKNGEILKYEFIETLICVAKFFSYDQAQALKDEGDVFLGLLHTFTEMLLRKRKDEGYLDFQLPEARVELDDQRQPIRIYAGTRLASHGWVEECMLLCNQAAARYLSENKLPGLYRVHEQPDIEVVEELWVTHQLEGGKEAQEIFGEMRKTKGFLNPTVQNFFVRLLDPRRGALPAAVQRKILRSMKKAQYNSEPLGHFALGWLHYSHFTSPIRRYSDLWIHRMMKMHLHKDPISRNIKMRAVSIASQVSDRELAVLKVERKSMRVASAWVFREWVGKEFTGEISGVENFGLFVSLTEPFGEGLIPVAKMRDDYYELDSLTGHLVGKRFHRRFELGQKVNIRVARSDPFSAQIDFDFLGMATLLV